MGWRSGIISSEVGQQKLRMRNTNGHEKLGPKRRDPMHVLEDRIVLKATLSSVEGTQNNGLFRHRLLVIWTTRRAPRTTNTYIITLTDIFKKSQYIY